jgi:type IV pilus assembly PilO-like protein
VTLSARDKKLLLAIVPVVVLFGYWFLLLAPKRQEGRTLAAKVSKQEQKRDELNAEVQRLNTARKSFSTDYATVVRLGKAIPNTVDMPSLIVQLQKAASGTGINFDRIHAGPRVSAAQATSSSSSTGSTGSSSSAKTASNASGSPSGSSGSPPASAAGGQKAGTGSGGAAEQANETKQSQDKSQGGAASAPAAPGTSSGSSSAQTGATGQSTPSAPGLDTVPLEFTFRGSFFDLSDFFHRLKRFVHVANDRIAVSGRLMTVDGLDMKAVGFPRLETTVTATVYLSPKQEGATAGATPGGPAPGAAGQSSASTSSPAPSQPPAAVATP